MTTLNVMPPRLAPSVVVLVVCAFAVTAAAPARTARARGEGEARPARSVPLPPVDVGDPRVARLNEVFERLAAFGFSGQVVLGERGRILLQRSAGWADADYRVPMTDSTQLGIGSITKSFVAATLLRLHARGRLDVEAPLARYLPGVPQDKRAITLHMLLTHTGGLPRDGRGIPDAAPRDSVVARVLRMPLQHPPGTAYQYSNAGYDLLAAVVERVTGAPMAEVAQRELLDPAGMTHTGWAHEWRSAGLPARGYNEWREVSAWTEWPERWRRTGSGAMVSTAADLWRWARALDDDAVLGAAARRRMFTRWTMDEDSVGYGYGMYLNALPGRGVLRYHGGDVDGYRAELRLYPDEQRTVVVLTNHDQLGLGVHRRVIANLFARLLRGDSAAVPPAVAHGEAARLGPWRGEYRLPGGGVIRIRELAGIPMVAAEGQAAADLFLPPRDGPDPFPDANRRAFDMVVALARGDTTGALPLFKDDQERDFGYPFLRQGLDAQRAAFGDLREVKLLGSASLPWSRDEMRTWLRVTWTDGSQGLFLGRARGRLNDVTFGDDRPAPVLLPVAVLADGTLGAWDVFTGRTVVMRRGPGGALVVEGRGGGREAARVR